MANKFLCIGGPFDGQMKTFKQVYKIYHQYNRSFGDDEIPSSIFIHASAFVPAAPKHSKAKTSETEESVLEVERTV